MSSSFEFPRLAAPRPREEELAADRAEREGAVAAAREEGFAAGLAAGRGEIGPAAAALAAAAGELAEARARAAEATERAAVELALLLAEKVLGAALELRPELLLEVVRGALRRLTEPVPATLLVNPEDAGLAREALGELGAEHGAELTVRPERRVERGGCLVRTPTGEVDAAIGAQLERAREVVAAELADADE
jgi:flagellar biosynthesis/type III secretory pathway protein FliH